MKEWKEKEMTEVMEKYFERIRLWKEEEEEKWDRRMADLESMIRKELIEEFKKCTCGDKSKKQSDKEIATDQNEECTKIKNPLLTAEISNLHKKLKEKRNRDRKHEERGNNTGKNNIRN